METTFEQIYSREDIQKAIVKLTPGINCWIRSIDKPVALCVLKGGVIFYTDLIRRLLPVDMAFCSASTYNVDGSAKDKKTYTVPNLKDRNVLIIDDICDSGQTLEDIKTNLINNNSREVKSVVLIHRVGYEQVHHPDWCAFTYKGPEWFAGYGMDYEDRGNTPDISIVCKK